MHIDRDSFYLATASICALIAAGFDIKSRKVPNLLTGPAVLSGIAIHFGVNGWYGVVRSIEGMFVCGGIFLLFYLAGGMGAGDVKLIAATGCLAGLSNSAYLLVFTGLAGGVMGVGLAVARGRLGETLLNVGSLVNHHLHAGLSPHSQLNVRNESQLRLPYAVAIAAGCLLTTWLHAVQG